jgi:hypothetical protein
MTPPHFLHFCDYLPFVEDLALYLNKIESSLPKDNFTKFDWIWHAGSGEEDFFLIISVFLLFRYCLPLEIGYPLRLNKLKSPTPELWKTYLDSQSFGLTRRQLKPVRSDSCQSEIQSHKIKKKNQNIEIIYKTFCWF